MSLSTPSLTTPSETCAQAAPQPNILAAIVKPNRRFMCSSQVKWIEMDLLDASEAAILPQLEDKPTLRGHCECVEFDPLRHGRTA